MNFIQNRFIYVTGRIVIAALFSALGITVLSIATIFLQGQPNLSSRWIVEIAGRLAMLTYSLLMILAISGGKISSYGFRTGMNFQWKRLIFLGLGLGILASAIEPLLDLNKPPFLYELSFLQMIVIVWIFSSTAEEILMRGLVQSFLTPLKLYGTRIAGVRISLPVFVAALFFGLIHTGLLTTGASVSFVIGIVLFTFSVGLVAGYYREKTNSLIPALIVHFMANVGGTVVSRMLELFRHF